MRKRVGIIGAGAAGLCSAKYMMEVGFDVTLYEIGTHVGGMWVYNNDNNRSSAYKTLHINTARDLTAFKDFPFDPGVQPFPDHRDMAVYLKEYAEHFDVTSRVKFKTRVVDIRPAPGYTPEKPLWHIETDAGAVDEHDTIMVCCGHLTKPFEVAMLRDQFKGEYLHSHYYRDPAVFASKRICVVGVGNSSFDIAGDLATVAERTVMVGRSTPLIVPKLIFGRPFSEVVRPFFSSWVPVSVRKSAVYFLTWIVHGRMSDLGFPPTDKKVHPTSNATIVNHIKYRRVIVKQGISAINGQTITFSDGTSEDFDTLIAATGYEIELDFMKPEIMAPQDNTLPLYLRIVPPKWRGLYFLGFFNSDTALNWITEGQVKWVREHELGRAVLPSEAEMLGEVAERKAAMLRNFKDTPRHGIEVEHVPYFQDLRRALKAAQRRANAPVREVGIGAEAPKGATRPTRSRLPQAAE